jgi:hypothetical protein
MSGSSVLFALRWTGLLCPCFQKDEDRNAVTALRTINRYGERIAWVVSGSRNKKKSVVVEVSSAVSSAFSSIGGLLRGGSNNASGSRASNHSDEPQEHFDDETNSTTSAVIGSLDSVVPGAVLAKLKIQDNSEKGTPEVFVDPVNPDTKHRPPTGTAAVGYKLHILLRRIHTVQPDPATNEIICYAKSISSADTKAPRQPPKELLRFVVLQSDVTTEYVPAASDVRNDMVHSLAVLIEWNRQRRQKLIESGEDWEDDDDDEDDQPNFLAARAQKAAHHAAREYEMQQVKRDREQRKAALVSQVGGGLKYTAIAMANRATAT